MEKQYNNLIEVLIMVGYVLVTVLWLLRIQKPFPFLLLIQAGVKVFFLWLGCTAVADSERALRCWVDQHRARSTGTLHIALGALADKVNIGVGISAPLALQQFDIGFGS
jgi:hypothetical protein